MSFQMSWPERIAYIFVFLFCLTGIVVSHQDLQFYEGVLAREDGFVEWMTVVPLLLGSSLCLYRAGILAPFRPWTFRLALYVMALIFLFGALEEISYGQRLIGFESPAFFKQYNTQHEFNFHNLRFGNFKINRYIFGTGLGIFAALYFLVMPVLYRKLEKAKNLIDNWAVPLPRVMHIIFFALVAVSSKFIDGGKGGEIREFGLCWVFVLMCFAPYNRQIFSRTIIEK